jgi:hypothetical protein
MSPRPKRYRKQEIRRQVDTKAPGEYRSGREEIYWVCLGGRRLFKVRVPKGRGALGIGWQESVRKDLRLAPGEFGDFMECPMTSSDYTDVLLDKLSAGLI